MELGLIVIPLGDGVDEITESRYQGNCQHHLGAGRKGEEGDEVVATGGGGGGGGGGEYV